jgi:RNA polymerase sigma-70 factor (ECF subfamily)
MLRLFVDSGRRNRRWTAVQHLVAGREDPGRRPEDETLAGLDVGAALAALSPRQRACAVLYYFEDQPVAAIAQQLRIGEGTVKRNLSEARGRLRTLLDPEEVANHG